MRLRMRTKDRDNLLTVGQAARQQALVIVHGLSLRQAARLTGVCHRTVWMRVHGGYTVRSWDKRSAEEQAMAVWQTQRMIEEDRG